MNLSRGFRDLLSKTGYWLNDNPTEGLVVPGHPSSPPDIERFDSIFSPSRSSLAASALFRARGAPLVVFKDAMGRPEPTDGELDNWHAVSWNAGIAPILWVSTPSRVILYNGYSPPRTTARDRILAEFELGDLIDGTRRIERACGRLTFDSGAFWKSQYARRLDRKTRVDAVLLHHLTALEAGLFERGLPSLMAQKLIGRTIFSQYLVDRGLLPKQRLEALFGVPLLPDILRLPNAAHALFKWLKATFNGDLFPPDIEGEDEIVRSEHLALLADFLEGHDPLTGQRSLFPFRFDVIPIELISSIYEQFAHSAAGGEALSQGLHYTPTNLVDLALDVLLRDARGHERVLDPACGSGVFLVESLRRLVWKRARLEGPSRQLVRDVLENQIYGVDINPAALQVSAFSLYLAALELDPEISPDLDAMQFESLIGRTLRLGSFLSARVEFPAPMDVVVGNPPWTYAGRSSTERVNRTAQPRRTPDWAFLWRAKEHCARDGKVGFLMKATPFFSNDSVATNARRQLLAAFRDVEIVNMAQLRTEGLFPAVTRRAQGAETRERRPTAGPALLFVGRPGTPAQDAELGLVNVPWLEHFRRNGVFELAPEMRKTLPIAKIGWSATKLKAALFANAREFDVMDALLRSPQLVRLGAWTRALGITMDQGYQLHGGGSSPASHLLGLPVVDAETFRAVRLPESLPAFAAPHAHRPRSKAVFEGPLVLCPEGSFTKALEPGRYPAAFDPRSLAFSESIVGISFKGQDPRLGQVLSLVLNSKLVSFQLAFGASNIGLKQPKVEKVDLEEIRVPDLLRISDHDLERLVKIERQLAGVAGPTGSLLQRLDEAVYDLCDLPQADRRVIDDSLHRSRPMFLDTRAERTQMVAGPSLEEFLQYGDEFTRIVEIALSEMNEYRLITNRIVRLGADIVALRFDLESGPQRPLGAFHAVAPELFEAPLIRELGGSTLPHFHRMQFLRVYDDRSIYVVKPDQRRFWRVSDAQTDAALMLRDARFRHASRLPIPGEIMVLERWPKKELH